MSGFKCEVEKELPATVTPRYLYLSTYSKFFPYIVKFGALTLLPQYITFDLDGLYERHQDRP